MKCSCGEKAIKVVDGFPMCEVCAEDYVADFGDKFTEVVLNEK